MKYLGLVISIFLVSWLIQYRKPPIQKLNDEMRRKLNKDE